ncbi:hypothetical protein [Blastococcus tunisiensis]|jgi:hypothetical protein|uniref:Uncharacterized protein n=1 Tax=Blastococcus tunisiensis TaxID=1798228 RepID=A0A1I2ICJ5_9ACTN|nr:hypothetical protein [Blastococcus sp. DSM 46838]SFF38251.1 hypothetical protein SAMN05216574_112140 [Blastococcus sp. DSM 46838]
MTASLFVTALSVGPLGLGIRPEECGTARVGDVTHAVAKPVVDGLEASVCGVLVRATAAEDWSSTADVDRCEECARIAG